MCLKMEMKRSTFTEKIAGEEGYMWTLLLNETKSMRETCMCVKW